MRVFIAGIMQGSRLDNQISDQQYRADLTELLKSHFEGVEVIDPFTMHPNSLGYDDEKAVATFLKVTALAGSVDVVLAFLPRASMGTAIELWTAFNAGIPTIVVTPLIHNWLIKTTATHILPDLNSLFSYIQNGELASLVARFTLNLA